MKRLLLIAALLFSTAATAQTTKVTPLLSRDLASTGGKEGAMLLVRYAPGAVDPVHRHDANVFVYVLKGSIVMQLRGAAPVTLHPGQTFYEGPDDIHLVGRNASTTRPAEFLAFFVKKKDEPIVLPAQ